MSSIVSPLSVTAVSEARRLLKDGTVVTNGSKKLLHRMKRQLRPRKGDLAVESIVGYVDRVETQSMDVLRALLAIIEPRVNAQTLQTVHGRLLIIAAKHGHIEILKYLLATGIYSGPSHQEALTNAVLSGHISCVEVLLTKNVSTPIILHTLLTTDYVDLDQARSILRILLNLGIRRTFLDYLILKMFAGSPNDFDQEILDMLSDARYCNNSQTNSEMGKELDDLSVYFEIQEQVRTVLTFNIVEPSSYSDCTASMPVTEMRQPKRNMFGDKTLRSSEHLVIRLLERYIQGCTTRGGVELLWSSDAVEFLLISMPDGAEELPEYARSISLAAKFQQTTIFTQLLQHKALPIAILQSCPLEMNVNSIGMIVALLDHLNRHHRNDNNYAGMISSLFVRACEGQFFKGAIQICSRSRVSMPISDVQQHLKVAIASDKNVQDISDLLKVAKVEKQDLDVLWEHVSSSLTFPTDAARMLLQAGCMSLAVETIFLKGVHRNETFPILCMILEEWKVFKTPLLRREFDYSARMPALASFTAQSRSTDSTSRYFPTLAAALGIAIQHQRLDLCQLLLDKNAPLVIDRSSLIEQAIIYGANHRSLVADKVLVLLVETEKKRSNPQNVLNFALLQAAKHNRTHVVVDLINQGASTLAYNHECWHIVLRPGSLGVLELFLRSGRGISEFSENFKAIFSNFENNAKSLIEISSQLYRAGLTNSECYSWVLLDLCRSNEITAQSVEQLMSFRVPDQNTLDQCLEECWHHSNLPVFEVLINKGVSQNVAEALFQSITQSIAASTIVLSSDDRSPLERARGEVVLGAMKLLLRMSMPQSLMNVALCNVALLSGEPTSLRITVLVALLQQGARFAEDEGLALLRCLLVDNDSLVHQIDASGPSEKVRRSALRYIMDYPNDRDEPGPIDRVRALDRLFCPSAPTPNITLTNHMIVDITKILLSTDCNVPTILIHHFYVWLKNLFPTELSSAEHCLALKKQLDLIVEGWVTNESKNIQFINRLTQVLTWVRPEPSSSTFNIIPEDDCFLWLPRTSLSRYLLAASRAGITPVVGALLTIGTSPYVVDELGKTALFWAATMDQLDMVKFLIDAGATADDGSLHEATCLQNHAIMRALLNSNHSPDVLSNLHDYTPPMIAFIGYNHAISDVYRFSETTSILMGHQSITRETCSIIRSAIEFAVSSRHAHQLILALLPWLKLCFDTHTAILELPVSKGPFRYSLLSLVDLWENRFLTRLERDSLVLSFYGIGFDALFYTTEGDQPSSAVNVPQAVLDARESRKRRIAFETKECCVCGDRAENENKIHAGLMPGCADSHSWQNDILCTECLGQYLESRMFSHDNVRVKDRFPSKTVPCWAPKCASSELSYDVLQRYSNSERFHIYDLALCQALIREGQSTVQCATPNCAGAYWYDESDKDKNPKIFFCVICRYNTCMECNDRYEKHDNLPCPASEEARKSERVKEEERLSKAALRNEKKCPKCKLMYQKYAGCDHIVCGKDSKVDSKLLPSICLGVSLRSNLVQGHADYSYRGMSPRVLPCLSWSLASWSYECLWSSKLNRSFLLAVYKMSD